MEFYLVLGMSLVTFGIRYTVLGASDRIKLPPIVIEALRYIPPAILTAIVVPEVLIPDGNTIEFNYTNARLVGAIAAIAIAYWRKNLLLTIVVGMLTFFAWQWAIGN
ncbi:AzlD domain-containing protein [Spirulina sp. 06S082]|uniref:AzlD domain-containing protein n=1 Tax=Spirulina sp. 06S082 TaxID=3110248 RepID=UPI002B208C43|nr:AzlD domain-containing protein [Spirulina sp. 06S082]MEA5467864.1 AzlD domain-containing protein [Spirulina sp. 06S082]